MKRKLFVKIISLMVLTVSLSMVCFGCSSKTNQYKEDEIKPTSIELTTEEVEVPVVDGSTDLEFEKVKIVTATIYPAEAVVESISWDLEWLNNEPNYEDVNEYLEVKSDEKDFRIAYLTILKGFEGSEIILKCTIDDVGLTRSTIIQFKGKPQELVVERPDGTLIKDGDIITLAPLSYKFLYEFNLKPTNDIDCCGSKYNQFIVSFSVVNGHCIYRCDNFTGQEPISYNLCPDDLIEYNRDNNKLSINVHISEENSFRDIDSGISRPTGFGNYFYHYIFSEHCTDSNELSSEVPDNDVYIKVNVVEMISGVKMCFYFNIEPDFSLSDDTIIF